MLKNVCWWNKLSCVHVKTNNGSKWGMVLRGFVEEMGQVETCKYGRNLGRQGGTFQKWEKPHEHGACKKPGGLNPIS